MKVVLKSRADGAGVAIFAGWQDTSVVMFRHLLVGRIENDFPFSMAGDAGF